MSSSTPTPTSPLTSTLTPKDLTECTRLLETIAENPLILSQLSVEERIRLQMAAGRVLRPARDQVNRRIKAMRTAKRLEKELRDRAVRATTTIREARRDSFFVPPPRELALEDASAAPSRQLEKPRDCYVCKAEYNQLHFFYDSMCPTCAAFNYEKRFQTASLEGRVALLTGARLKIGYQAALMMLRAGARVIVTTRFAQDAAARFAREPDFKIWKSRIQVHALDLRHSPSVEVFARYIEQTVDRLDILINNAAQTVRRPPGFYAHLLEAELLPYESLTEDVQTILKSHQECKRQLTSPQASAGDVQWLADWHTDRQGESPLPIHSQRTPTTSPGITDAAMLSQIPYRFDEAAPENFPAGRLDADLQQVDHRKMNSWRMTLADVPTAEMLEVQLVNSVAPFILCSKLKGLMLKHPTGQKHIVNVSAMEGKFSRHTKTDKHPHTNMAKAALNMLTLTSARDYAKSGIYMNAVDTGWVTDEDPAAISARKQAEHDFQPPLDIVDGAARVCDPIFSGLLTGKHSWGNFLKDYRPTEW